MSTQSSRVSSTEIGCRLRRRPRKRNQRPLESRIAVVCRRVAKLLRDGGYSYHQSKHLTAEARRRVGLTPPQRKKGSVDRLTREELEALLSAAYAMSGIRGFLIRSLLETASRVGAFCQFCVEDIYRPSETGPF